MAKLHDITIFLDVFKQRCEKYGTTMEETCRRAGYSREWKLYKNQGIICRDDILVHLADGSPVEKTKAPRAAVAPDAPKSDSRTPRPVLQFTKTGEFVREWSSMMEAERDGFCHGNVSLCCLGRRKSAYGYIWKYKD